MLRQRIMPGQVFAWEGEDWVVVALGADGTRISRLSDAQRLWIDMAQVSQEESFRIGSDVTTGKGNAQDRYLLACLSAEERTTVMYWRNHIVEVETGSLTPGDEPRPGYETPLLTDRRLLKVQELNAAGVAISVMTFRRKQSAYAKHGLRGLARIIHGLAA